MTYMDAHSQGLPNPDTDPQFYRDVAMKRLLAWVIDTVLITGAALLIVAATLLLGAFFFPVIFVTLHVIYRSYFLMRHSATPGMRLMAIEIRSHNGGHLSQSEAIMHTLVYSVVAAFILPQIISVFLMYTGPRGQGLHDLLLGTTAINRPVAYS